MSVNPDSAAQRRSGVSPFDSKEKRRGVATSIKPEDLELPPFNQRGGLGKADQLFGEQLPKQRATRLRQSIEQQVFAGQMVKAAN